MADAEPIELLRRAAEVAPQVLPQAIAELIKNEIEHGGPHIKRWDDGDERHGVPA